MPPLTKQVANSPSSTTANTGIIQYIVISTELLLIVFEFICTLTLAKLLSQYLLNQYDPSLYTSQSIQLCSNIICNIIVLIYVLFRFSRRLDMTISQFLSSITTDPFKFHHTTVTVLFAHTIGFIVFYIYDNYFSVPSNSYLTLNNWLIHTQTIDLTSDAGTTEYNLPQISDMILFAPLREEIVFRGIILSYLMVKLIQNNTASANQSNKQWQIYNCVISGCIFGLIHLLNLFSSSSIYSTTYCIAQILLGICVGIYYSLHLTLYNNISELIIMHCCNNLYSSFVPLNITLNIESDMILIISLSTTFVLYTLLNILSIQQLLQQPYKIFRVPPGKLHDV